MMDKQRITDDITAAMKAHDKPRLSILRQVKNEIDMLEKSAGRDAKDEEVVAALKKVLRQTGETLEASVKAGTSEERTQLLQTQVDVLRDYLPRQVEGPELEALVEQVLSEHGISEKREMGRAMGFVTAAAGGNLDKAEAARMLGSRLS